MISGGERLPCLARAAIAARLGVSRMEPESNHCDSNPDWQQPGACFVTLTKHGDLRGCIGSLQAWRPLIADLRANAEAAALHDPRFPAVTATELPTLRIEVSVLTAPTPLVTMDHAQLIATLRPGIDGVILSASTGARATFLPQVWEELPDADTFLHHLKLKAGIAPTTDDSTLQYAIYQVEKFKE